MKLINCSKKHSWRKYFPSTSTTDNSSVGRAADCRISCHQHVLCSIHSCRIFYKFCTFCFFSLYISKIRSVWIWKIETIKSKKTQKIRQLWIEHRTCWWQLILQSAALPTELLSERSLICGFEFTRKIEIFRLGNNKFQSAHFTAFISHAAFHKLTILKLILTNIIPKQSVILTERTGKQTGLIGAT